MRETTYLSGQFLIAMPSLSDPNFNGTVSYICEHSDQGALGIVINRPSDLMLGEILDQLALTPANPALRDQPVYSGGPVQQDRGFVLHDGDGEWDSSMAVGSGVSVTTSRDILAAIASGNGPGKTLIALGYAGWGAGQLEREIAANAWLSVAADSAILFDTPHPARYQAAARLLGIDLSLLSTESGHA
jgi:putative transcriptional regulator